MICLLFHSLLSSSRTKKNCLISFFLKPFFFVNNDTVVLCSLFLSWGIKMGTMACVGFSVQALVLLYSAPKHG